MSSNNETSGGSSIQHGQRGTREANKGDISGGKQEVQSQKFKGTDSVNRQTEVRDKQNGVIEEGNGKKKRGRPKKNEKKVIETLDKFLKTTGEENNENANNETDYNSGEESETNEEIAEDELNSTVIEKNMEKLPKISEVFAQSEVESDLKSELMKVLDRWWDMNINKVLESKFEEYDQKIRELEEKENKYLHAMTILDEMKTRETALQEENSRMELKLLKLQNRIVELEGKTVSMKVIERREEPEIIEEQELLREEETPMNQITPSAEQPDWLNNREIEYEFQERNKRRNWVILRGMGANSGLKAKERIQNILWELTGVTISIQEIRVIGGGILLKLESWKQKRNLIINKFKLRGTKIRIEDDLTLRENQVQDWIKGLVKEARKNGIPARYGYMKWTIGANKCFWHEEERRIEIRRFRGNNID